MTSYKDYPLSADTTQEAEEVIFQLLGKKSSAERLQMVSKMSAAVRTLAMSGLRQRHPAEPDVQLRFRLVELLYGADVAEEVAEKLRDRQRSERRTD